LINKSLNIPPLKQIFISNLVISLPIAATHVLLSQILLQGIGV